MMMNNLPPMLCPACGLIETPFLRLEAEFHVARVVCTGCHNFLRWLPKAILLPVLTGRNEEEQHGKRDSDPYHL